MRRKMVLVRGCVCATVRPWDGRSAGGRRSVEAVRCPIPDLRTHRYRLACASNSLLYTPAFPSRSACGPLSTICPRWNTRVRSTCVTADKRWLIMIYSLRDTRRPIPEARRETVTRGTRAGAPGGGSADKCGNEHLASRRARSGEAPRFGPGRRQQRTSARSGKFALTA